MRIGSLALIESVDHLLQTINEESMSDKAAGERMLKAMGAR